MTTYAVSANHLLQHDVIKFISDLREVSGFLRVIQFLPPIKKQPPQYNWNMVERCIKHHKSKTSFDLLRNFLICTMYLHSILVTSTNRGISCIFFAKCSSWSIMGYLWINIEIYLLYFWKEAKRGKNFKYLEGIHNFYCASNFDAIFIRPWAILCDWVI